MHSIGRLWPKILLYEENNLEELAVEAVFKHDLWEGLDAIIVIGTCLKVLRARMLAKEFCHMVKDRRRPGVTLWINKE